MAVKCFIFTNLCFWSSILVKIEQIIIINWRKNHAYTFLYGHCRVCNDFRSCRSRKVSQDFSISFSLCIGLKPLSLTTPAMSMTLLRSTLSQPKLLLSQPLSQHLSQPLLQPRPQSKLGLQSNTGRLPTKSLPQSPNFRLYCLRLSMLVRIWKKR